MSKTLTSVGRNYATAAQGALSSDMDQSASHWIRAMRRLPEASSRLFCFPHAGGSATTFRHWAGFFQPTVEVCVVHRSVGKDHLRDAPLTRIGPAVEAVCAALVQWSDKPFAFFGHSIGALIAFEVARRLAVLSGPGPSHLFVSACCAPSMPNTGPARYKLTECDLIEYLRQLGGTPDEVFENDELLSCLFPSIRADLELGETYSYLRAPALRCPITALGGVDDLEVSREGLDAWREESAEAFSLKLFPGNHFFIHGAEATIASTILNAPGVNLPVNPDNPRHP